MADDVKLEQHAVDDIAPAGTYETDVTVTYWRDQPSVANPSVSLWSKRSGRPGGLDPTRRIRLATGSVLWLNAAEATQLAAELLSAAAREEAQ